jgi:predicted Zn-dependent peptidase
MTKTPEYQIHTFPNGIRVVHKQVLHTKLAHCGFMLDVGSRDEKEHQVGIAHFWEHMAFKGTTKRKAFHIINSLESVGGELNAYTTKEKICFHASVLVNFFDKAVDILTDITFNSIFPEKEIEKERGVILEEMSMYLDTPDDAINDEFDEVIYKNHPLGNNILGTEDSVKSFQKSDFEAFIKENIDTNKIIFSSVSNLPFDKVIKAVERFVKDIPSISCTRSRIKFEIYKPQYEVKIKPINQAHCMMGKPSYSLESDKRLPFFMLNNILGGPGLNSRLNLVLREKYGYVYGVDSSFTSYVDTGLFNIYFGSEKKHMNRCIELVNKEVKRLKDTPLGTTQLHSAKAQLMGQLAMSEESNSNFMLMMAKSILDLDKIDTLNTIFDLIKDVTAQDLQDLANEMFDFESFSYLIYKPK